MRQHDRLGQEDILAVWSEFDRRMSAKLRGSHSDVGDTFQCPSLTTILKISS